MKGKVMAPFRPPREGRGRDVKTKQIVHRKDYSRRFKELEQTMGRLLTAIQTKDMDKNSKDKGKGVPSPYKEKTTKAKRVNAKSSTELADDTSNPWWPKESPDDAFEATNSDNEDDDIPIAQLARERQPICVGEEAVEAPRRSERMNTLSEGKHHVDSDSDDDDVPITTTLRKPPKELPTPVCPKGNDAIGLIVARDFGADGGIYHGKITAVDIDGRRTYYHVTYDDGDEEDFDYDELKYAVDLQEALALGTYVAPMEDEEPMSDGEGSLHVPSDDEDETELGTKKIKRKRKQNTTETVPLQPKAKKTKTTLTQHTLSSLFEEYSPDTEYGASLRAMSESDQVTELARLNKGVAKGTNIAIKSKLITAKYQELVAEKMRAYHINNRQPLQSMFRANSSSLNLRLLSPDFISVGEWVEVDADRTPGWNSEGGIGVVVHVVDAFADVK
jgi:hypothetical protein